jgi:hypothetical protein
MAKISVLAMFLDSDQAEYLRDVLQAWDYPEELEPKEHRKHRKEIWIALDNYLNSIEETR